MPVGNRSKDIFVQVLSKNKSPLDGTGRAHSPLFTGECYQDGMTTLLAPGSCSSVGKYSAVEIPKEGFCYAVTKHTIALLKTLFPTKAEIFAVVEDYSIQRCCFRTAASILKLLLLGTFPGRWLHIGLFVQFRRKLCGVWRFFVPVLHVI